MKKILFSLLGLALMTSVASAETLNGSGTLTTKAQVTSVVSLTLSGGLDFGQTPSDANIITRTGVAAAGGAPTMVVTAQGVSGAWSVELTAADLSDGATHTIPSASMSYAVGTVGTDVSGGSTTNLSESAVADFTAAAPQTILSATAGSAGTFTFTPVPSNFSLAIPADTVPGTYIGSITGTVTFTP